jgi:hypothetical protein
MPACNDQFKKGYRHLPVILLLLPTGCGIAELLQGDWITEVTDTFSCVIFQFALQMLTLKYGLILLKK